MGLFALAGCEPKDTPPQPTSTIQKTQEPRVQNAFTDYVDRGVTTMNKAQSVTDAMNGRTQQVIQQGNSAQE